MMAFLKRQYRVIRALLHKQTLPGFTGIPIAVILKFVWKEILRDDIVTRANSMAYSFFLSIFPGMLVMLSLLPYFPIENMVTAFQRNYVDLLPGEMATYINTIIVEMTAEGKEGLLSVGLLLAIIFASNGVSTMLKGFHKSYESTYHPENLFQRQWRALYLTGLLGVLLLSSLVGIVVGKSLLISWLTGSDLALKDDKIFSYIRWVLVFVFYYIGIGIIYRFGPAMKQKLKIFSAGATMATVLSVISSIGFSLYVENFFRYNTIYGSIGALILILVWLQINSFIILIGYELNASIAVNRDLLAQEDN